MKVRINLKYIITIINLLLVTSCYQYVNKKEIINHDEIMKNMTNDERIKYLENSSTKQRSYLNPDYITIEDGFYIEKNIKFKVEDYMGRWEDFRCSSLDFIIKKINKNKFIVTSEAGTGICKIEEKTNNSLLLKCKGSFASGPYNNDSNYIVNEYINLKLNYVKNFCCVIGNLSMTITFNPEKECAKHEDVSEKNKCYDYKAPYSGSIATTIKLIDYYKVFDGEKSICEY